VTAVLAPGGPEAGPLGSPGAPGPGALGPEPASDLYAEALWDAHARRAGHLLVRRTTGERRGTAATAELARWCGRPSRADAALLRRCTGPTLDLGCGPGRLTAALGARGIPALGVDLCRTAVALTRARGADALHRSLFSLLPYEGRWAHVLLVDGNIGIGGAPVSLLRRCGALAARRSGTVLVEVGPPGSPTGRFRQRLEYAGRRSADFGWAHVAVDALAAVTAAADLTLEATWADGGRWFGCLRSR